MKIDLNNILNNKHKEFFKTIKEEVIFYGGSNAGKSYSTCDKILLQSLIQNKKLKILVVRKTLPSLKKTCLSLIQERAKILNIPYQLNKTDMVMTLLDGTGTEIYFISIDDVQAVEKIKSFTDVDIIWIEEANELTEDAYNQLTLRLRGGQGLYKQIICTLNPISISSWIYRRFFINENKAQKIRVTIEDNPWASKKEYERLEQYKQISDKVYNVYRKGEWGSLEGNIYTNWEIVDSIPGKVDEIIYGLDFGFNAPTSLVKIYLCDGVPYFEEKIYESGLTNVDLINKLKTLEIGKNTIYADCAEPARIEELRRNGFIIIESDKDVLAGINYIKTLKPGILSNSVNIIKEYQTYAWDKNKDNLIDKPVKFMDHSLDAIRYALYTHKDKFEFVGIGPDGGIINPVKEVMQRQLMINRMWWNK